MRKKTSFKLYFSFAYLVIWILVAILSPFIASDQPLVIKKDKEWSFPVFGSNTIIDYKDDSESFKIWPLVPFSPGNIDLQNTGLKSPGALEKRNAGTFTHILGTDHLGRDVLSGLIYGASVAFKIVSFSLLISSLFGICLGLFMGYFGDSGLRFKSVNFILVIILSTIFLFHLMIVKEAFLLSLLVWSLVIVVFYFLLLQLKSIRDKEIKFPFDLTFSRVIEILESIPKIFLLIAIFAGFLPSIAKVIVLIAIISWPGIAKVTRAETLNEKNKQYIESGKALGFGDSRLIFIHILPNIIAPVLVYLAFDAGAIILIESFLSFLGLGVPADVMTWGRMLAIAKNHLSSWWLVFFPGFFIFATVYSLNTLGSYLSVRIS